MLKQYIIIIIQKWCIDIVSLYRLLTVNDRFRRLPICQIGGKCVKSDACFSGDGLLFISLVGHSKETVYNDKPTTIINCRSRENSHVVHTDLYRL